MAEGLTQEQIAALGPRWADLVRIVGHDTIAVSNAMPDVLAALADALLLAEWALGAVPEFEWRYPDGPCDHCQQGPHRGHAPDCPLMLRYAALAKLRGG